MINNKEDINFTNYTNLIERSSTYISDVFFIGSKSRRSHAVVIRADRDWVRCCRDTDVGNFPLHEIPFHVFLNISKFYHQTLQLLRDTKISLQTRFSRICIDPVTPRNSCN